MKISFILWYGSIETFQNVCCENNCFHTQTFKRPSKVVSVINNKIIYWIKASVLFNILDKLIFGFIFVNT